MEHDADVVAIGTGTGPGGETVPAVILAVREECLPIFVSPDQAQSIGMALEGEPFERPLAHDLLLELLTEFGGAVNRVRIDDLIDGTFYAKVDVERYEDGRPERFVFDSRPSDALALAARVDCPIIVTDEVVEKAGQPPETVGFDVPESSSEELFQDPAASEEPLGEDPMDDPLSDEPVDDPLGEAIDEELEDVAEEEESTGDSPEDATKEADEVDGESDVDGGGSDDGDDGSDDGDGGSDDSDGGNDDGEG